MSTSKVFSAIVTTIMLGAALYIGYKNHKKEGFWFGVLALALLGTFIELKTPNFTFYTGVPKEGVSV